MRVSLGFLLVAAAAGCHHEAAPVGPVTNAKPVAGMGRYGGDDLAYLPIDSELVFGLDWRQLQTTELYKQVLEPHRRDIMHSMKLDAAPACGVEVFGGITSATGGLVDLKSSNTRGVFVVHGLSKEKLVPCIEANRGGLEIVEKGGTYLIAKGAQKTSLTFLDGDVALIGMEEYAAADLVERMAKDGGKASLKGSPAFGDMVAQVKRGDTVWFLMHDTGTTFPMGISAVYGSLQAGDGLTGTVHMRTPGPTEATTLATSLTSQAQSLLMFVDKLVFHPVGADVVAEGGISVQKLQSVLQMAGLGRQQPASGMPTP